MNKTLIVGAVAVVAVFAGVVYLAREPEPVPPARVQPSNENTAEAAKPAIKLAVQDSGSVTLPRPTINDPRLAALMASPDNGLIEFVPGADGKVIREIDNDPNSPGYRKSLREYMYAGGKVVGVTKYRYVGNRVEVTRALVTYKPDGSVDQYQESTH